MSDDGATAGETGGTGGETGDRRTGDRLRGAASSAGAARDRLIHELAAALAVLVRRVRLPMLVAGAAPLPPALVLAVEGLVLGGTGGRVLLVLAVVGVVPGLWVLLRRRRMVRAVDPVDALAGELSQAYDLAGMWTRAGDALRRVRAPGRGWRGATRAAGGVWAGVKLTRDLFDRFSDLPRVEPFLPIRLQTTLYLGVASLVAAAVLTLVSAAGLVVLVVSALS